MGGILLLAEVAVLLASNEIKMYRRNLVRIICIRRDAYAAFRLRVQAHPSAAQTHPFVAYSIVQQTL